MNKAITQELEKKMKEAKLLNADEKYSEVIELINEDSYETILMNNANTDTLSPSEKKLCGELYAQKAEALHSLKMIAPCKKFVIKALSIDPENLLAKYYKGYLFIYYRKYHSAIKLFKRAKSRTPDYIKFYNGLGAAWANYKDYEQAKEVYEEAIKKIDENKIDENKLILFNALGDCCRDIAKNDKKREQVLLAEAKKWYKEAIEEAEKTEKEFAYPYNGLGDVASQLEEYSEAKQHYTDAIKKKANFIDAYYNRAQVYYNLGEYHNSLNDYKVYIDGREVINPLYDKLKRPQFLGLNKDHYAYGVNDYYYSIAKARVEKLKMIIDYKAYETINNLVSEIKKILLFKGDYVTHYTSLSASKSLILENSLFRLSEGVFLNDTSEGRELFHYLSVTPYLQSQVGSDIDAKLFVRRPFIGSFVADSKEDDLTLWRMYGKENKEEGKGCAITLDRNQLLINLVDKVASTYETVTSLNAEEDFEFYRVAYLKNEQKGNYTFIISGLDALEIDQFEKTMENLKEEIVKLYNDIYEKKDDNKQYIQAVQELLNEIAYLFKVSDYQYEDEIRLVVKGNGIEKNLPANNAAPRVYIELSSINSLIKKLILGPKVESKNEWAATFYYRLEKEGYHPEILISHLPYK